MLSRPFKVADIMLNYGSLTFPRASFASRMVFLLFVCQYPDLQVLLQKDLARFEGRFLSFLPHLRHFACLAIVC